MVIKIDFAKKHLMSADADAIQSRIIRLCFLFFVSACILLIVFSVFRLLKVNRECVVSEADLKACEKKATVVSADSKTASKSIGATNIQSDSKSPEQRASSDAVAEAGDIPVIQIKAIIKVGENYAAYSDIKNLNITVTLYPGMNLLDDGKIVSVDGKGINWIWKNKNYRTDIK